jgi:hypothetical protein
MELLQPSVKFTSVHPYQATNLIVGHTISEPSFIQRLLPHGAVLGLFRKAHPIPKSRRPGPIAFDINLSAFEKLAGEGTYIGYENPEPSKNSGSVYLKDEQGEHMIPISHIKKK